MFALGSAVRSKLGRMRRTGRLLLLGLLLSACGSAPVVLDERTERASRQMAGIDQEVQLFYLDHGRLPYSLSELRVEISADPWGAPYRYEVGTQRSNVYQLTSAGPDGSMGTRDDIQIGAIR